MTRVRYRVVAFAVALAAVTYLDRVCIATLAPDIMLELKLSRVQMSYVFSAFTLAYAIFEIPTAWWGEKIGARRVLTRIVVWWSTFTILTAAAWNFWVLATIRFLFGAGEAGAWPNAAKTFSNWIPAHERGRVQGIFFMGAHLAGGVTPALVSVLLPLLGWRGVFVAFGLLGFVWAAYWRRWYRDDPAQHPSVSPEEVKLIHSGRLQEASHSGRSLWRMLPTNSNLIFLCITYFANGYGFYFLITWLPTYLEQQRGFSKAGLSLFAGLPLLVSVLGDLFGGITTDYLVKRFGLRFGRVSVGAFAYFIAAIAILASAFTANAVAAAALIAAAAAASMFTLAASWACCIDIGGKHSGVVSAAMNTSGQVGGILSPIVLAYLVEWFADWRLPLIAMCLFYSCSAAAWLFVNPNNRLA
jgi:MFS family permease